MQQINILKMKRSTIHNLETKQKKMGQVNMMQVGKDYHVARKKPLLYFNIAHYG